MLTSGMHHSCPVFNMVKTRTHLLLPFLFPNLLLFQCFLLNVTLYLPSLLRQKLRHYLQFLFPCISSQPIKIILFPKCLSNSRYLNVSVSIPVSHMDSYGSLLTGPLYHHSPYLTHSGCCRLISLRLFSAEKSSLASSE